MLYEKIIRDQANPEVCLETYLMDPIPGTLEGDIRPAVLIFPGGGYQHLSPREGEPLASWCNANGLHAFVLHYTIQDPEHPVPLEDKPLLDASWAMSVIRGNAEAWHVDPGRVAVMGFSAGGHLAAHLGVMWQEPWIASALGIPQGINRPDAMILSYAVLTAPHMHRGSFVSLYGENVERIKEMSLERHVSENTPPAFIWHTMEDQGVPVENALIFAQAMQAKKRPYELHIFEKGSHGISTCMADVSMNDAGVNPATGKWMGLCMAWLKRNFHMR